MKKYSVLLLLGAFSAQGLTEFGIRNCTGIDLKVDLVYNQPGSSKEKTWTQEIKAHELVVLKPVLEGYEESDEIRDRLVDINEILSTDHIKRVEVYKKDQDNWVKIRGTDSNPPSSSPDPSKRFDSFDLNKMASATLSLVYMPPDDYSVWLNDFTYQICPVNSTNILERDRLPQFSFYD